MHRREALKLLAGATANAALPILRRADAAEVSVVPARPDGGVGERAAALLKAQAAESLPEKIAWAERIKLGDPHKYIQPIICAKLVRDPADKEAWDAYRWIKTVDIAKQKGDRGMYHFSAIYKTRLFFGWEKHLPADVREWFLENEAGHLALFRRGGTENHGMMSRTSGYVWAERFAPDSEDHRYFRDFLVKECRKLYTLGQGEWDSSTYIPFTVAGWANVYDFARDPKMRDLARAALDWYATAIGLKYFHGILSGPEARGFADAPVDANTDVLNWLWFGGAPDGFTPDLAPTKGGVRYSIGAALSGYRPDPVIARLARKEVALPFGVRASKPQYYGYDTGNVYQEALYFTRAFGMGTLYDPTAGDQIVGQIWPQTTQFKLVVALPKTTAVFGAANPYHRHFPVEGRSPYDQFHQARGALVNVCYVPEGTTDPRACRYSLLAVPDAVGEPAVQDGWHVWEAGDAYVAARPLGSEARWDDLADWAKRTQEGGKFPKIPGYRWLRTDGAVCGWVLDTGLKVDYRDRAAFVSALRAKASVDVSRLAAERRVIYRSLAGDTLTLRHTGDRTHKGGKPEASTNGKPLVFADWPVYESKYVSLPLKSGVLTVTDGTRKLTIDFSGEWPVWRTEG